MLPYLITLSRIRFYISRKFFYALGTRIASHPFIILFSFLFIISYASYPIIFDPSPSQQTVKHHLDGHLWQATPHLNYLPVKFATSTDTATNTLPTVDYIAKQVVLTSDDTDNDNEQQMLQKLLTASLSVYKSITISNQLRSICALNPQRQCIIHSPFSLWDYDEQKIQRDADVTYTINQYMFDSFKVTGLPLHPATFMGNITQDKVSQQFTTAKSIILTFILRNTQYTNEIWNEIWDHVLKTTEYPLEVTSTSTAPYIVQYKLKVFPNITFNRTYLAISLISGITLYIFVRNQFTKSKLLKSHSGLGVAALFLSASCFTLTRAILRQFNATTGETVEDIWSIRLIACISTTVQHILLITQAVVARERKDIRVNERVGKGLQQVGIQMTTTLLCELLILAIGSTMKQKNAYVTSFCLFTTTALIVGYILCLTLYIAILSIDIRRAELADLANNHHEHLHEPVPYESEETLSYFYAQQYHQRQKSKSRRAFNALLLCIVLLILHFHEPSQNGDIAITTCSSSTTLAMQKYYTTITKQFWSVLNPNHSPTALEIQPPSIVAIPFSEDPKAGAAIRNISICYSQKFDNVLQQEQPYHYTLLDSLHPLLLMGYMIENMNAIPTLILYSMVVGILFWMIPPVRERVLSPCLYGIQLRMAQLLSYTPLPKFLLHDPRKVMKGHSGHLFTSGENNSSGRNDVSGNHGMSDGSSIHFGAISLQSQFNKRQNLDSIHHVKIKTLLGMHVTDLLQIHSTEKYIVSVGQDDKLVLWDLTSGQWIARLDKLRSKDECWFAEARPLKKCLAPSFTAKSANSNDSSKRRFLTYPRCAQVSPDSKYVVAGFENGALCVWDTLSLQLLRELSVGNEQEQSRTLLVQFLDEHTFISAHKNNSLQVWNVQTGESEDCIEESGHSRDITHVFSLPDSKEETQLVWTASGKEGLVKCWERRKKAVENRWQNIYSINIPHCVTSMVAGQLQDKSGILVLGSMDGAVRVYNYTSGEHVCTLSKGGYIKKKEKDAEVGGPLLKFSTVAVNEVAEPYYGNKYSRYNSNHDGHHQHLQQPGLQQQTPVHQHARQQEHNDNDQTNLFDHQDSISQVVLTPIRIPDFENDMCPQCKTTLSLGYFVASCALDGSVHVWRLIKTATSPDSGCTFCAKKNYYRHSAMKQAAAAAKNDNNNLSARRKKLSGCSSSNTLRQRMTNATLDSMANASQQQQSSLLQPLFLGKLSQIDGHGLVFCDNMVLAGLRRTVKQSIHQTYHSTGDEDLWEVWFASLQYYEPPSLATEEAASIPVISHDLQKDETYYYELQQRRLQEEEERMRQDILKKRRPRRSLRERFLLKFFGIRKVSLKKPGATHNPSLVHNTKLPKRLKPTAYTHTKYHYTTSSSSSSSSPTILPIPEKDIELIGDDEEDLDAYEVLPFSSIHHATNTNGQGLSCDYGNFIKVISFEAKC